MLNEKTTDQLIACTAMSLYQYNVDPLTRAEKLYEHFSGLCCEMHEMLEHVDNKHWATQMAAPTALWYMQHAMERYGREAEERVQINLEPFDPSATRYEP